MKKKKLIKRIKELEKEVNLLKETKLVTLDICTTFPWIAPISIFNNEGCPTRSPITESQKCYVNSQELK